MDFPFSGWRLGVLALVAALAIYLAYLLWHVLRLQAGKGRSAAPAERLREPVAGASSAREPAQAPEPEPVNFATQQFMRGVEAELDDIRRELIWLRDEVARLKASRHTSPHYAEAMALARGGADAQTVAARCGISLGEAELVLALSREDPARH